MTERVDVALIVAGALLIAGARAIADGFEGGHGRRAMAMLTGLVFAGAGIADLASR